MHRCGADCDEARDVVDVDRVAGDRDDVGGHTLAGAQEVRVHSADGKGHRYGHPLRHRPAVAQSHDPVNFFRLAAQARQRVSQGFTCGVRCVQDRRFFEHARELRGAEDRRFELEELAVGRNGRVVPAQQLAVGATLRLQRGVPRAEQHAQ